MTDTIRYKGPAIREGGGETVTIQGNFVAVGEQKLATGTYMALRDARFPDDEAHGYFVTEADFNEGTTLPDDEYNV